MARKKKHEEHVNHERWLVSYADFITLLFAFFVVMYAISSVNEGKYRVLSDALVTAFRSPPKTLDPIQVGDPAKSPATQTRDQQHVPLIVLPPVPRALMPESNPQSNKEPASSPSGTASGAAANLPASDVKKPAQEKNDAAAQAQQADAMQSMAAAIKEAMDPLVKKGHIAVHADHDKIEIELKANILYASGSARLEPQALPVLEKLAEIVRPFPNTLNVEGFTDNQPIRGLLFPSNWELSAARAASVVHVFADNRISPERMAAIGYGEYRPIADNDSEEGRNKNRRVVIVILAHADNESKTDASIDDAPLLAAGEVRGAPVQSEAAPLEQAPPPTPQDQPAPAPLFAPIGEPNAPAALTPAIQIPRQVPAIAPAPVAPSAATTVAPHDSANPKNAPIPPAAAPTGTPDDAPPASRLPAVPPAPVLSTVAPVPSLPAVPPAPISSAAPAVPSVPAAPPGSRISVVPPVQIVPALPPVQIVPTAPAVTAPASPPVQLNTTKRGATEPKALSTPPVPPAPAAIPSPPAPNAAPALLAPPPAVSPSRPLAQTQVSAPPPARAAPPPGADAANNLPGRGVVAPPLQLPPLNIGIGVPPVKVLTDNPSMRAPPRGGGN